MNKPTVFISYSHKDEEWKDRLVTHLRVLEKQEYLIIWDDRRIGVGDDWYPEIVDELEKAAVTICLISADFLTSDFIHKEEIPVLKRRRSEEGMLLLPILVQPCLWKTVQWLKGIQMFPRDGKTLAEIRGKVNQEKALSKIAELVYEKIKEPEFQLSVPSTKWKKPNKLDIGRLPKTGMQLFGRQKELQFLDEMWDSDLANVISFVAWGGVGKSTLINQWLEYMNTENYRGAKRVFGWSFYSQGTSEKVTSADSFISEALKWFGDSDPTKGSPWDKGNRLADLIRKEKTLLILDGLEPLQSGHEFEKGKIKDPALSMLVNQLARNNNGLCLITTREKVRELKNFKKGVKQLDLEQISKEAGRALLRVGGVQGTDAELESASERFGNHALAINLLATFLYGIEGHHISNTKNIPILNIPKEKGKYPRSVIAAFEERFGEGQKLQLLNILGLFDRPARIDAIEFVYAPPSIDGLTDKLQGLNNGKWNKLLEELRDCKLLAQKSKHNPNILDCHPLIREHFGEKLQEKKPEAWKEAHDRLYEYYKNLPEKEYPDTLEEMEPLFAAVMHGCMAGKHQEALDDVYFERIERGNEAFINHKLGAFGADLSCLSNFFERLWYRPASSLIDDKKAAVLNWAGFALRAVGRLSEATQPTKASLDNAIKLEYWKNAAIAANNLSELYLTMGNLAEAQEYGRQSVTFADRSGDGFEKESDRTTYADALHQAGDINEAEKLFIEAENMHQKRQQEYRWLFSLFGYRFCDLLFSMGKYQDVLDRAKYAIEIKTTQPLLDFGLNSLTIGRVLMFLGDIVESEKYLNQAVEGLREAGAQEFVPRGLFARAKLYRHKREFFKSWCDLDETREIAEYGQMRLHLTDYHLEAARVINCQLSAVSDQPSDKGYQVIEDGETLNLTKEQMQKRFNEHFREAEHLIEETGYHRRDKELEELGKR